MDGDSGVAMDKASSRRLFLPSLIFSAFATYPMSIVSNLLLVEMSLAFGQPVGVMSQMRTLSSVVGFLSALAMGALSVRFGPKTLLPGIDSPALQQPLGLLHHRIQRHRPHYFLQLGVS